MDAYPTDQRDLSYSDKPPILLIGDSDAALARTVALIEGAGLRIADTVPVSAALERLRRQAAASGVWIELDGEFGSGVQSLLDEVNGSVADGRYAAIVSTTSGLIDPVAASLADPGVEILIDADDQMRAAALATALSGVAAPRRLSDVATDKNAARLRQLSEEVSRIASTLARLSTGPATPAPAPEPVSREDVPAVSVDVVRAVIRARRLRARFFSEELFADPAWDMLLDLLQAEISQLRVPVSSLCIAAAVPATTALRWLKTLVQEGIFVRRADPHDGRRVFVELSEGASLGLRRYFAEVGKVAVI